MEEILTKIINLLKPYSQGIISVLSVILGAYIGHLFSTIILRKQLEHDSKEREKERKTTTRKEVYLQAVENLSKANFYLGSLSSIDLQKTNIAIGFQDLFMSFSKISLIAEQGTVECVLKLSTIYNEIIFSIIPQIIEINKLTNMKNIEDELYNENQLEIKRILEKMIDYNENQVKDIAKFQTLNENYKFEQEEAQKHHTNRQKILKEYIQKIYYF